MIFDNAARSLAAAHRNALKADRKIAATLGTLCRYLLAEKIFFHSWVLAGKIASLLHLLAEYREKLMVREEVFASYLAEHHPRHKNASFGEGDSVSVFDEGNKKRKRL